MYSYFERLNRLLLPLFNLRVIAGALIIACLSSSCFVAILLLSRPGTSPISAPTALLSVIHAPTAAPTLNLAATSGVTNPESGTPPPGLIANGVFVQVSGTSGEGLRLRSEPGLGNKVLLLASEAEVFRVTDGPREVDGYTWWYLVGSPDEARRGWAVANYLAAVQNP